MTYFEIEIFFIKKTQLAKSKIVTPTTHHRYKWKVQKYVSSYQEHAVGKGHT